MLSKLDLDVTLQILELIDIKDVLALRRTSKHLESITRLRAVWYNAVVNHVIARDIPFPRVGLDFHENGKRHGKYQDITILSTEELEKLTLGALKASDIWEQATPTRLRNASVRMRVERTFILKFLRMRSGSIEDEEDVYEGRYLLTLGHMSAPRICMQVWDVDAVHVEDHGVRLAGEWRERGRVIGLAADKGNGLYDWTLHKSVRDELRGALVAVSARCFDMPGVDMSFILNIVHFNPSPAQSNEPLSVLKSFSLHGPVNVRAMRGNIIAIQVRASDGEGQIYGHGSLKVVDWIRSTEIVARERFGIADNHQEPEVGDEIAVELEASAHGTNRCVLRVQFIHDWILVFRESVIELYFLPPSVLQYSHPGRPKVLRPSAQYKWNWQINSITVTERVSWKHDRAAIECSICSGRRYVLRTAERRLNTMDRSQRVVCACQYRPLSIIVRFDSYFPWPVNLLHHHVSYPDPCYDPHHPSRSGSPFLLPPTLIHTIPSNVRLFGHSVLASGRFGTLIWTDSEAQGGIEGELYGMEGLGERVAGCRLPLPAMSDPELSHLSSKFHHLRVNSDNVELDPLPPPTAAQLDTMTGQVVQSSLFSTRLSEGWFSLALSERAGRIALGDGNGGIELWDYF